MRRWIVGVRSASTASSGHGQGISVAVGGEVVVVGRANVYLTVRIPCLPTPGRTVFSAGLTPTPAANGLDQAIAVAFLAAEPCWWPTSAPTGGATSLALRW
jgi:hypothetical protein